MKKLICLSVLIAVLASTPAFVVPQTVRVDFKAVIYEIDDPFWYAPPTWVLGDTLVGYFEYELGAVDASPDPTKGFYHYLTPPSGLMMTLKGYTYSTDTSQTNVQVTVNDSVLDGRGRPWDGLKYHSQINTLEPLVLGVGSGPIQLQLWDSTGVALPNDSLPISLPPLSAWTYSASLVIVGEVTYFIRANLVSMSMGTVTGIVRLPDPSFILKQNHPNPFSGSTSFYYNLPSPATATITIYDVHGRRVARIVTRRRFQGTVTWNGLDDSGQKVASGIYFYRLDAGGFSQTKKMVILR